MNSAVADVPSARLDTSKSAALFTVADTTCHASAARRRRFEKSLAFCLLHPSTSALVRCAAAPSRRRQISAAKSTNVIGSASSLALFSSIGSAAIRAPLARMTLREAKALAPEEARLVACLYAAALDRYGAIALDGLNYWMNQREARLS